MVEIVDLFSDPGLVEAVVSGLPLRIRIRVQLWKDGLFDSQKGQHEWRATLLFDPLTRRFRLQTSEQTEAEVEVNTLEEVREALQLTLQIPLRPREKGKYYYIGEVEMETLSLSDLEELQRWLQGELAGAVAGEGDVDGALAKGFRRVLVRMLGLPAKRFQVQSPSFRVEGGNGPNRELPPDPPILSPGELPHASLSQSRAVSFSIRSSRTLTPIPGPEGTDIIPPSMTNSGSTTSWIQ
jgi:hypothetical protein